MDDGRIEPLAGRDAAYPPDTHPGREGGRYSRPYLARIAAFWTATEALVTNQLNLHLGSVLFEQVRRVRIAANRCACHD